MSHARVCDGCGVVLTERPYENWWTLYEDDGRIFQSREEAQFFHFCSLNCVMTLALREVEA